MKIVIPDERPTSWNAYYAGRHWRHRQTEAERVHWMVRSMLPPNAVPFERPVEITVTVFFDKRPFDCCNVPAKLYIDGLKERLLHDDSPKYVRSVTTRSVVDPDFPRVEIQIREVYG